MQNVLLNIIKEENAKSQGQGIKLSWSEIGAIFQLHLVTLFCCCFFFF